MKKLNLVLGWALVLALLASCSEQPDDPRRGPAHPESSEAPRDETGGYVAIMRARHEAASAMWIEQSLTEFLPRQKFVIDGVAAGPRTKGIVIGDIVSVEPGVAFAADKDSAGGTLVPFDADNAAWRNAIVTVRAGHNLSAANGGTPTDTQGLVRFSVFVSADEPAAAQMSEIQGFGKVLVVLDPERTTRIGDQDLPWIARGGDLLGRVDGDGQINFPAMQPAESAAFVGGLTTVPAMLAQFELTPEAIRVSTAGDVFKRLTN